MKAYGRIDIGGKERPIKLGHNAFKIICDELGIKVSEIEKAWEQEEYILIVYAVLFSGAKADKIPIDFDKWDVGNWLDELSTDQLKGLFETIAGLMGGEGEKKEKPKQ